MTGRLDLNADLGEDCGDDDAILPLITSANIAAGAHAGGGPTLTRTVQQAAKYDVNVGAHISYPDRDNFGRTSLLDRIAPQDLAHTLTAQLLTVHKAAAEHGVPVTHVKAHGALYNDANAHPHLADLLIHTILDVAHSLGQSPWPVFGLPDTCLAIAATEHGIRYVPEAFADRAYAPDGTLTPRHYPHAVLHSPNLIRAQAVQLATTGTVPTYRLDGGLGSHLPLTVETLCLHGDTPDAVANARSVRTALLNAGVTITGFTEP